MGNCCRYNKKSKRKVVLLLVGLDNAGKTVAAKGLAGENLDNAAPTIGFSVMHLKYMDYNVQIYDLGGGPDIRGIWHRYFVDAHGIIFVIDASDYSRLNEAKCVLHDLLSHEKISGKPVLLLANKQDYQNALDEIDIVEKLELEYIVNAQKCPTLVESCCATELTKNKTDPGIKNGYHWLLNCILKNYLTLDTRVNEDVKEQKCAEQKERQERIAKLNLVENFREDKSDSVIMGDPFKPITELINDKNHLDLNEHIETKKHKTSSDSKHFNSYHLFDKKRKINPGIVMQRPKSAVQSVKKQLIKTKRRNSFFAITTNKTSPVILFTPKSAMNNPEKENPSIDAKNSDLVINFKPTVDTGNVLTVTELPNAIIDLSNGNHIGDLFQLNHIKNRMSPKKLPPISHKRTNDNNYIHVVDKPIKSNINYVQNDIEAIYKDIS